jgi:branched-chain amino acid transport system permease protein
VLGIFLLGVILFLPRGIGSLWIKERRKRINPPLTAVTAQKEAAQ